MPANSVTVDPIRARDARGRTPLHRAALAGCEERCRALLAQGADPDALDDAGRSAAALVPSGDPSCDPEDCAAWRALARRLAEAEREARHRVTCEGFERDEATRGAREWVLRACGSPLAHGGGTRVIRCVRREATPEGFTLTLQVCSEYAGINPAFDPPWSQEHGLTLRVDARGWPRSFAECVPVRPVG